MLMLNKLLTRKGSSIWKRFITVPLVSACPVIQSNRPYPTRNGGFRYFRVKSDVQLFPVS